MLVHVCFVLNIFVHLFSHLIVHDDTSFLLIERIRVFWKFFLQFVNDAVLKDDFKDPILLFDFLNSDNTAIAYQDLILFKKGFHLFLAILFYIWTVLFFRFVCGILDNYFFECLVGFEKVIVNYISWLILNVMFDLIILTVRNI